MTQRQTIGEFGLRRSDQTDETFVKSLDSFDFLVPFSGPTKQKDWHFRRIFDLRLEEKMRDLHRYAYNSHKKAYVVFEAFLEDAKGVRLTEMRLWQILLDNWMIAGSQPDSLRYVAFSYIVNTKVGQLIDEEWAYQAAQADGVREYGTATQRMLTITPNNSTTWDKNPFIRSGVRVAANLSTAERAMTCDRAHLIRRYISGLYMVLEFKNGDPGQENYRESLIRRIQPLVSHNVEQKQAARAAGQCWEDVIFLPSKM